MATTEQATEHRTGDALTVHSMGGLGNQLFIYGAGLAAAAAAGVRLRVDVGQHAERPDRPPLLESLGLPAQYVDLGRQEPPSTFGQRVARRIAAPGGAPWGCTHRERGYLFDPSVLEARPGDCLFGYFQSWRYLQPVEDGLRAHLFRLDAARIDPGGPAQRISHPRAVVMHVRRGDYLHEGAQGYHGLTSRRFYVEAVAHLRTMGFDGPAFLFSDDVPAALRELAEIPGLEPLVAEPTDALDEMLLMSRAPALVTANSSFSWWAGWLGDRPGRPVIAPRPWFDDPSIDARDLLPPHWLTLDRRDL
jgi:hypothetical protein